MDGYTVEEIGARMAADVVDQDGMQFTPGEIALFIELAKMLIKCWMDRKRSRGTAWVVRQANKPRPAFLAWLQFHVNHQVRNTARFWSLDHRDVCHGVLKELQRAASLTDAEIEGVFTNACASA